MQERTCTGCREVKPATPEFYSRNRASPSGLHTRCKACRSKHDRDYFSSNRDGILDHAAEYREANRELLASKSRQYHRDNREVVLAKMRASALRHEYGLTPEQYLTLLDSQGGTCAYCKRPPKTKSLSVDHDHVTGEIRGLLCPPCNTALGRLGDSIEGLMRAVEYLSTAQERVGAVLPDGPEFPAKSKRYAGRIGDMHVA